MTDVVVEDEPFFPYISENGRIEITVGTTFSYGGHSHWPKVMVSESRLVGIDDNGETVVEDSDDFIYRVTESTHYILGMLIPRIKADIDARNAQDRRARTNAINADNQ